MSDIFSPPESQFQPQPLTTEKPQRKRRESKAAKPVSETKTRKKHTRRAPTQTATVNGDPFKPLMELIDAYKAAPADVKAVFRRFFD